MTDEAGRRIVHAWIARNPAVHRVLLARVEVVDPGSEQASPAKLAPILVGNHVVRVVGAGALVAERPDQIAGQPSARLHADASVGRVSRRGEHATERGPVERLGEARVVRDGEPRREGEQIGPEVDDLFARCVEADCVVDCRSDRARGRRALGLLGNVGLEHVLLPAAHLDAKAGGGAVRFALIDEPAAGRGRARIEQLVRGAGAARELFARRAAAADAVLEPSAVGHFVECIRVDGFARTVDRKRARERPEDRVVHGVPRERRDIGLRRARHVAGVLGRGAPFARDAHGSRIGVALEGRAQREAWGTSARENEGGERD